jgi:hypothetical protein
VTRVCPLRGTRAGSAEMVMVAWYASYTRGTRDTSIFLLFRLSLASTAHNSLSLIPAHIKKHHYAYTKALVQKLDTGTVSVSVQSNKW